MGEITTRVEADDAALMHVIERAATDPNVDIEKMERLLAMHERIVAKQAEAAFAADFSAMQSELPTITKRGEIWVNNELRSKYARFDDIDAIVKPILLKYGFGISFRIETGDKLVTTTGILMHRAGHREQTSMALPSDMSGSKNAVQALGSSTTYGRRYVLCALLNISTGGEDDDGVAAGSTTVSEEQAAEIKGLLAGTNSDVQAFLKTVGSPPSVDEMGLRWYEYAVRILRKKAKKAEAADV